MEGLSLVVGLVVGILAILGFMYAVTKWLLTIRAVVDRAETLLQKELTNNHGSSLKDKIDRIERKQDELQAAHLETHALVVGHERELGFLQGQVSEIKEIVK